MQEAWLRLSRPGNEGVVSAAAWLRTVVARIALDMLRARKSRRETILDDAAAAPSPQPDPEQEAALADAVGGALMVVLDRLQPGERVAFVLHDMFALPFEDIGGILSRSPTAARQLASRARRRVRGTPARARSSVTERAAVAAFLAAARSGNLDALLKLLDPDVVLHTDGVGFPAGTPLEIRGAAAVAQRARLGAGGGGHAQVVLVGGLPGTIVTRGGRLQLAFRCRFAADGRICEIEAIADAARLRTLAIEVPES